MSGAGNRMLDFGLLALTTESDRVFLCAADPVDYAAANSTHVGVKNGSRGSMFYAITSPIQGGRLASLSGFLDGDITSNGTANFVVVADSINQNILITEALAQPKAVKVGGKFAIATLDVILGSSSQPQSTNLIVSSPVLGTPVFAIPPLLVVPFVTASPFIGLPIFIAAVTGWTNIPVTLQTAAFTCEFDAVPSAVSIDNTLGLSNGPATDFPSIACGVVFNLPGSVIQARNGGVYAADAVVAYSAAQKFHIRMFGNILTHTYSVWATPFGQSEVQLANNYAFRTEQAAVTQLNNFTRNATELGIVNIANLSLNSLIAIPFTTGSPSLARAVINDKANFVVANFAVGGPVFPVLTLKQKQNLAASGSGSALSPTIAEDFLTTDWTGTNTVSNDGKWVKAGIWTADGGTQYDPARCVLSASDPSGGGDGGSGFLTMTLTTHASPPFGTELYTFNSVGAYGQGYYEWRAKMPGRFSGSAGIVGFFQIQGNIVTGPFGPNEIDIEFTLNGALSEVTFNMQNTPMAGNPFRQALGFDPSAGYHRYGVLWLNDGSCHWYIDGIEAFSYTNANYVANALGSICLNMWCGNPNWGGVGPPTQVETTYVDWVKFWAGVTTNQSPSGPAGLTIGSPVFMTPSLQLNLGSGTAAGAFNSQTGNFTIQWDAVPSTSAEDVCTGLCNGPPRLQPAGWDDLAVTVRFPPSGNIDCRSGTAYTASATVPYSAGMLFHFRVVVRMASHTYDVYVTPQGQSEILLANNFGFRETQTTQTTLNYLGKVLLTGDVALTNMIGPPLAPPFVANKVFSLSTGGASWVAGDVVGTMTATNMSVVYPISASVNGRSLVTASGQPWLMMADAGQGMCKLIPSDVTQYLTTRAGQGFNSVQFDLIAGNYFGIGNANLATNDGLPPCGTGTNIATAGQGASAAYWTRMDSYVNQAASLGLTTILNPIESATQGPDYALLTAAGTAGCTTYGQFIGNRYKNFPNIIWQFGNDYDGTTTTEISLMSALINGVLNTDTNHLAAMEFQPDSSSYTNRGGGSLSSIARLNFNSVYAYRPTYGQSILSYNAPSLTFAGLAGQNRASPSPAPTPTFLVEGIYANESQLSGALAGSAINLRRQSYWLMCSGGLGGQIYGCGPIEFFSAGWQAALNDATVGDLQRWYNFFTALPFQNLIPDQTHVIGTAGYGTANWQSSTFPTDNYVTVCADSVTGGAHTAVVYFSLGSAQSLTINMAQFAGQITAKWFDPSTGTYTLVTGTPFANSGTRVVTPPSAADWVLLLTA